jgi:hypothetical protein
MTLPARRGFGAWTVIFTLCTFGSPSCEPTSKPEGAERGELRPAPTTPRHRGAGLDDRRGAKRKCQPLTLCSRKLAWVPPSGGMTVVGIDGARPKKNRQRGTLRAITKHRHAGPGSVAGVNSGRHPRHLATGVPDSMIVAAQSGSASHRRWTRGDLRGWPPARP